VAPPTESLNPRFLETAIDAVRRAGEIQMSRFGSSLKIDRKGTIDLVSEVDLAVEAAVRSLIAERFPNHQVLAEEEGLGKDGGRAAAQYRWVFDPLDGTTNFVHGLPIFCSSLALERDGVALVGAVLDPTRGEIFTATRGGGAFLNGSPIGVSSAGDLIDAMLCTGFPYDVHERVQEIVGLFGRFVGRARAVRRLGSAAIDLCYVAAGRLDGFWERGLQPWDIAAGALMVQEAGGRVTGFDGAPFTSRGGEVIASNGRLHTAMVEIVTAFRARSRNGTT
jgi:myo-inositol-1(or 4)-monophosphatase